MARVINWDQKLSDADREWASQRDEFLEKIEENERRFGGPEPVSAPINKAERIAEMRGLIDKYTNEIARLEKELADEANTNSAFAGDQVTGNSIVDFTPVNGQKPDGAPESPEDYLSEKWTIDALKDDIKRRNAERATEDLAPISMRGTKSELIERIQADDREIAAA